MNKCYIIGKVVNEPIFKFFFMEDNISICYFWIELKNNSRIKVFALNNLADCVYQNVHSNQIVLVDGCLNCKGNKDISIKIKDIEIINLDI